MEAVLVPAMGFFYSYERTKGSVESEPWELSYVCELTVEEFPSANGLQPVPLSPVERKRYLRLDPELADCPEVEVFRQELGPREGNSDECRARALYEALMSTKRFKKTKDPTQSIGYSTQAILGDTHLQGKIAEARDLHTRAQQLHEASGNRAYWAEESGNLGLLALQQNKLEEAEGYFQQGLRVCQELGDMQGISGHYQDWRQQRPSDTGGYFG